MPTRLIIIRHGNTFNKGETLLRVGAGTDLPLTDEGLRQASRVGKYLVAHDLLPAVIFSSPLRRTMQTADCILAEMGSSIPIEQAEFLREIHYGQDDGKPEEEVIRRIGQDALDRWNRDLVPPPGWEVDVPERFRAWQEFGERMLEEYPDKTVLAVTSNGIARFVWGLLADETAAHGDKKLATGAFSIFTHTPAGWQCDAWNVRPE